MNSTVAQPQPFTSMSATNSTLSPPELSPDFHVTLLVIYSIVFLCGTVSLSLMMHILKSSAASTTSITVFNLIFAHFIFLLTVPFRLYYYATSTWTLGLEWCKMVSGMIHIHMYMSFLLYMIILITRLWPHYCRTRQVESLGRMHALIGSVVMWVIVLILTPCVIFFHYGKRTQDENSTHCFRFAESMTSAKVLNYILSTIVIVVAVFLTALQANVLWVLYSKDRQGCTFQQDFGAQMKSLCFTLIMLVCFVPYHVFRLYYIGHPSLENVNEVLLSLTTFNCLDMLTFLGKRTFYLCFRRRSV